MYQNRYLTCVFTIPSELSFMSAILGSDDDFNHISIDTNTRQNESS